MHCYLLYSTNEYGVSIFKAFKKLDDAIDLTNSLASYYLRSLQDVEYTGVITNRYRLNTFDLDEKVVGYAEVYNHEGKAVYKFYIEKIPFK